MAKCIVIGGPNGIGKSTQSEAISIELGIKRIDPDQILREDFPNPDKAAFPYFLSGIVQDLFEKRVSFIYESNLHTLEAFEIIKAARQNRFHLTLIFFCTDDLALLNERVDLRHQMGLHFVPKKTIAERHGAALRNLPAYLDDFDAVSFYDGSPNFPDPIISLGNYSKGMWELVGEEGDRPEWLKGIIKAKINIG